MIFYLLALAALCVYQVTIYQKPDFNRAYLSKESTASIRGIFVLLIVASHARGYVKFANPFDTAYLSFAKFMSQTVVVMFLFYSGFGVMESVKGKGEAYIRQMPVKRILITYLNIVLALVFFFLAGNLLLGRHYTFSRFLAATIGLQSLGNSTWYLFAILFLYAVSWISFLLFRTRLKAAAAAVTLCCAAYVFVFVHFGLKDSWWYNTIFCYAMGMWYSCLRGRIERVIFQPDCTYYVLLALSVFGLFYLRRYTGKHIAVYECWSLVFCLTVILLTMKIGVHNPILNWCGEHTFEIYIMQRIPMNLLEHYGLSAHPYRFFPIALASTLILAWLFGLLLRSADKKALSLFQRSRRSSASV